MWLLVIFLVFKECVTVETQDSNWKVAETPMFTMFWISNVFCCGMRILSNVRVLWIINVVSAMWSAMLNGCNTAEYSLMLTLLYSLNPVQTGRKSQVVLDLCASVQRCERIVTPFCPGSSVLQFAACLTWNLKGAPPSCRSIKLSNDVDGLLWRVLVLLWELWSCENCSLWSRNRAEFCSTPRRSVCLLISPRPICEGRRLARSCALARSRDWRAAQPPGEEEFCLQSAGHNYLWHHCWPVEITN